MRLPPLDPAVAETRRAVRAMLSGVDRGGQTPLLLVALSGGADSLALAAALAFEGPRSGVAAGAVVVDHGLQPGSAEIAERAASAAHALGLDPVIVRRVRVDAHSGAGLEAEARRVRYAALEAVRLETGAGLVITAHTRDDQAEQVLLALARGSGTRAVAAIPPQHNAVVRPFLSLGRSATVAACAAQGLTPWNDPHNTHREFARVRARELLPVIERDLGPGVVAGLARSAEIAREDADALDAIAAEALARAGLGEARELVVPVTVFAGEAAAIRHRMIRQLVRTCWGASLSRTHTLAITALVTNWHGQGPIDVPGGSVRREAEALTFRATRGAGPAQ